MGVAHREMGAVDKAFQCYEKALEVAPSSAVAWNNMGVLLSRTGNLKRALICFNKAIEHAPDMEEALLERERVIERIDAIRRGR